MAAQVGSSSCLQWVPPPALAPQAHHSPSSSLGSPKPMMMPRSATSCNLIFWTDHRSQRGLFRSKSLVNAWSSTGCSRMQNSSTVWRSATCNTSGTFSSPSDDDDAGDQNEVEEEEFIKSLQQELKNKSTTTLQFARDRDLMDLEEEEEEEEEEQRQSKKTSPFKHATSSYVVDTGPPRWLGFYKELLTEIMNKDGCGGGNVVPPIVGKNANSVDLLRMIKKRKASKVEKKAGGDYYSMACCSMNKAFSSMVFIIRELHSYTLQLRELLFLEDMQGIVPDVQKEMHASFCWLFQQIFSCTPTLMLSVMLLLANFTVHSMTTNTITTTTPPPAIAATIQQQQVVVPQQQRKIISRVTVLDASSAVKEFDNIGGGGGSKTRPPVTAGATDDGRKRRASVEEIEARAWKRIVDEAEAMQAATRHRALMDKETLLSMVAPVKIDQADELVVPYYYYCPEHFRTELIYQTAVREDPENSLLLCNYAQFLHLVVHDHDRAEHYFKKATEVTPVDGESLSRYANFLWVAKKDMCAAEETYLQAIAADPNNTALAANYANFLWNTGGEDTCFPLLDG